MAPAPPAMAPQLLLWGAPLLTGAPGPFAPERRYQLLVLLGLQAGQWVERDRIASVLWPAHPLAEARRNLRKVVFRARAVPGVQRLEATEHALRWDVDTDLQAFDDALRRGEPAQALDWRRGRPLDGIDDPANRALDERLAAERARLEQAWLGAALDHLHRLPDPEARARAARRVLEVDPLDDAAMAALLEAERALGRDAEAQSLYRRYAARLGESFGIEPSRALRDLVHAAPSVAAPPSRPRDDDFVGRRLECTEALALLARPEVRALALLGPGGIGKSRLARRLRADCDALFAGGVFVAELQDSTTLPAALARVAQALGAPWQDDADPVDALLRRLPAERSLCVLDNIEHLPALPPVLQRLLDAAPQLVLLLTSRVRPGLAGEWVLPLAGLAVPDEDSRDLDAAASFDAVRLFAQRATAARPDFRLERHLPAVIDIVDTVGGLPLAIELAAAWVRLLPPEEVAQDLHGSIDVLERDPAARPAPARADHASLRAVLDGSWRLLGPPEREALAALSVFEGGFTRAAAQAAAGCSLPLLSALVDKSLAGVDEAGRFALHPVVAAFARERLASDPRRAAEAAARHAAHFARALAALRTPGAGGDLPTLVTAVRAEFGNVMAAWRHARAGADADGIAAMLPALRAFFEAQGRLVEGAGLLREALAAHWPPRVQAMLQHAVASLLYRKGDLEDARAIAEAGLAPAQASGDRRLLAACLMVHASALSSAGRPALARPPFERALALLQALGDRPASATALSHLGVIEKKLGRFDAALERYAAALAIDRELGNVGSMAIRLNNIAGVHMEREQWSLAQRCFEDALRLPLQAPVPWLLAYLAYGLGVSLLEQGATAAARAQLEAARTRALATDLPAIAIAADAALGRVALAGGDLAGALVRLQDVARRCRTPDYLEEQLSLALYWGEWLRAVGRPDDAARVWAAVVTHPAADAGLRRSAERWRGDLPTGAGDAPAVPPAALDDVLDRLQAEPPPARGNGGETPAS